MIEALVRKIQKYYGRAIRDNSDDNTLMKKPIFRILFHLSSPDNPKHVHCPEGDNFLQRALAKTESPESHKTHEAFQVAVAQQTFLFSPG